RWNQSSSTNDHLVLHHHAIAQRRAYPHQHTVADGARVQIHRVTDGDIIAAHQWKTLRVERTGMSDVQNGAVLNAGAGAYTYRVHVTAYNRVGPDGGIVSDLYLTDYHRCRIDQHILTQPGRVALMRAQGR